MVDRIELPYPPHELSPNARPHYYKKARVTKQYRALVGWKIKASKIKPNFNLKITFHPRSSTADKDNAISSFKAGQDGIADAFGVNDRDFNFDYVMSTAVKGGKVIVEAMS